MVWGGQTLTFNVEQTMGAALGAGAVGGALVGDHLDKKREEQEKAALYRQIELEKQKRSDQEKEYVDGHYENVKKKKSLPPGLAKKVARGGTLPPGWQMKVARDEVMD